jgi:hypothetical protein
MSAHSFYADEQVAGTESELDTQRKARGVMRAERPFKQCFDACSSMASCGHRLLQMSYLIFVFVFLVRRIFLGLSNSSMTD